MKPAKSHSQSKIVHRAASGKPRAAGSNQITTQHKNLIGSGINSSVVSTKQANMKRLPIGYVKQNERRQTYDVRRNTVQDAKAFAFPDQHNDIAAYLDDQYTTINMNQSMEQKFSSAQLRSVLDFKRPTSAFLYAREPRPQLKNANVSELMVDVSGYRTVTAAGKYQSLRVQEMLDANMSENQIKIDPL